MNEVSKNDLVNRIYGAQRSLSRRRKMPYPNYSNKQLKGWAFAQSVFHKLYEEWIRSGNSRLKPSFDRINAEKPYTLENLKIITWHENWLKGLKERKSNTAAFKQFKKSFADGKERNRTKAAKKYGVTRQTIHRWIKSINEQIR